MKARTAALLVLAILLGLTVEIIVRILRTPAPAPLARPAAQSTPPDVSVGAEASPPPAAAPAQPATPLTSLRARIDSLLARLQAGEAGAADLAQLERELFAADPRLAIRAILQFLGTGQDAPTGEEFALGEGGKLAGAPTLRVALMDWLGRLSKQAGTADAAQFARTVLDSKNSADEWALSLRNVAWHDPRDTAFLAGKLREMLAHEPWLARPSAGMLEAFDIAVFTKDPTLVPTLASNLSGGNRDLQRAAAVALDRLAEAAALPVMTYLNGNPQILSERPFVRADYFAKADLSQPAERQAVENYLTRPDISLPEKTKLLKGFVTPASFVSDNLLTAPPVPADDSARFLSVEKTTKEWITTGRFPDLTSELQKLQSRIPR